MYASETSYNKGNNRGAKVGNWVEEYVGKAHWEPRFRWTGQGHLRPRHCARQLPRLQLAEKFKLRNISRDALVGNAPYGTGPRQRAIDEALMKKAFEETKMEAPQRSYFTTSSGDAYVKKPFISKVGARVMKSLDGRPIPTEGRDNDFLVEFSLTKPKPKSKAEVLRNAVPRGDYTKQVPITMYSQRMSEGCYKSTAGGGATPFGRSSGFTNDMADSRVSHIEGTDDHTNVVRGAPPPPRPSMGSQVSIQPLIKTIKEKIVKRAGNDGLHALSRMLRIFDADGNGKLSRAELRDGLRDSGVDLTAAQSDQVFAYFDRDRSGYVTVGELMRGMREGLNPGNSFSLMRRSKGSIKQEWLCDP